MNKTLLKPAVWFVCDKCGRDVWMPKTILELERNGVIEEYYRVFEIVQCPHDDCRAEYEAEEWELSDD